jgi:hypothetical protein
MKYLILMLALLFASPPTNAQNRVYADDPIHGYHISIDTTECVLAIALPGETSPYIVLECERVDIDYRNGTISLYDRDVDEPDLVMMVASICLTPCDGRPNVVYCLHCTAAKTIYNRE